MREDVYKQIEILQGFAMWLTGLRPTDASRSAFIRIMGEVASLEALLDIPLDHT